MALNPNPEAVATDLLILATEELHEDETNARKVTALASLVGSSDKIGAALLWTGFDDRLREYVSTEVPDLVNWFHPEV